jgi:hypothetical protein
MLSRHGITNLSGRAEAVEFVNDEFANEVAHLWKHQLGRLALIGRFFSHYKAGGGNLRAAPKKISTSASHHAAPRAWRL